MTLKDYRETFYEFSRKLSDIVRHIAFLGFGIIWLFNIDKATGIKIPNEFMYPMLFLIVGILSDVLQYISGTVFWGYFQWSEENKLEDTASDPELDAPSWYKWPQMFFFIIKIITIFIAYVWLFMIIKSKLFA